MSWLNNTAASVFITIDGEDYTSELVSGQITDGSAINTGAVLTGGIFEFTELPGATRLEDYNQTKFGRGKLVLIDVEIKGQRRRHPRGYLYVLGSTYNMETRSMSLEAGCLLTMHNLTDEVGDLESFTDFKLTQNDDEVPTFANLLSAVNAEGKFLWQDNQGDIKKEQFFEGDGLGSGKAEAAWVSVRNHTALSIQPLGSANIVPDKIKVNYSWQVESDTDTDEDPVTGKPTEIDTTVSTYWLEHPANLRKKQKVCTTNPAGEKTCKDIMVNQAKRQYSVTKTTASRRTYGATGGSVSVENELTTGPAVEMNGAYYAELYAYRLAQNDGNPVGISPEGLDQVTQTSRERTYEYGTGGEVLKTIEKSYKNLLGAMTTNDWRAGNAETGIVYNPEDAPDNATRGFLTSPPKSQMFLQTKVTTEFTYYDDRTVELTTTIESSAGCNGVGIYPPTGQRVVQDIGAENNGITTTVKRTSTGGLLNPDQPPRNPGGKTVTTKSATYIDESSKYLPTDAGSVTLTTNVPYAYLNAKETQMRNLAANYAKTLRKQLEGDAAGIRVAETMRDELFDYKPGMPFSFFDTQIEKLIKLRMNSTGWAMTPGQSIFSTEGCFIGESNGTVVIPNNTDPGALVELGKTVTAKKDTRDEIAKEQQATQEVKDQAQTVKDDALQTELEKQTERDDAFVDKAQAEADLAVDEQQLADAEAARDDAVVERDDALGERDDAVVDRDGKEAVNDQAQQDAALACAVDPDGQACSDAQAVADATQADLDAAQDVVDAAEVNLGNKEADLAVAEDEVDQREYDKGVSEQEVVDATAVLDQKEVELTEAQDNLADAQTDLDAAQDALDVVDAELQVAQDELDVAEQEFIDADAAIEDPPRVEDETVIDTGGDGPSIVEFIAVELSIGIGPNPTGNGDDGIGIVFDWSVPEELRFNTNALVFVSGEKVTKDASILEQDLTGTIPEDGNGSLLVTTEEVIIPDLFDPDVQRNPDDVFEVLVAPKPPTNTYAVRVFAAPPDQIYEVKTSAVPPDQIFNVETIETFDVSVAQLPFIVEVGPEPPDQIFDVVRGPDVPNQIFSVTRGPSDPYQTFEVLAGTTYVVTTSFGIPDKIFKVTTGPRPAPDPDFTFNISVGGSDAPPIPTPDETFVVSTGFASPDRIFEVKIIENLEVEVYEKPFYVSVFAEPADQVFEVTTNAREYDQIFTVTTMAEPADETFEVLIVNEFEVDVYDRPAYYTLQEAQPTPGNYNYVVTGGGFNFADSPTINLTVGQQFRFQVDTPANTVWIKKDQETGPGELDPYWGDMINQGINQGFLYFRPWEPGTFYYQSEFDADVYGQINVTGDGAPEPDQIFDVTAGADPNGADEIFEVIVGPEQPLQTFVTTVEGGAPPVHQTFDVRTWAEVANQVFEARTAEEPITWAVASVGSGYYQFSGGDIPQGDTVDNHTINIETGQMAEFLIQANGHPFWIKDVNQTGTGEDNPAFTDYIVGNGTQTGSIRVIFNRPGTYYYVCQFHGSMQGEIVVTGRDNGPTSYFVAKDPTPAYIIDQDDG